MTATPLRTVLVGLGRVGAGYADDPIMSRHYPYATHAQVLAAHPGFAWEAVIDCSDAALDLARARWQIPHTVRSAADLRGRYEPEVAVVATPPDGRRDLLAELPSVRAVLVEKPLGVTSADASAFLDECREQGLQVQVNIWRRADRAFRELAAGRLADLVGRVQVVFGVYGNGLLNNGTHMVDFVRMLFGEVDRVQALGEEVPLASGPIRQDVQVAFSLRLASGLVATFQPLRFEHYRENGLDIWGEAGRLSIVQEGLVIQHYPVGENRAMQGEREVASDRPSALDSTVGHAFYEMYSNLAAAVLDHAPLWSPGESALRTARLIEAVRCSAQRDGAPVALD
jgi:predicted dehydrogenase